ncbi:MAG TPA: hypothetical protein DC049_06580 [Spirochaetia bacterium]|nr:hypothetical protein [Spirochaetia bacterium]
MNKFNNISTIVSYFEVDCMGIVHNSVYLQWLEKARMNFSSKIIGFSRELFKINKVDVIVKNVFIDYLSPAKLGLDVQISSFCIINKNGSFDFEYIITSGDNHKKLARAKTTHYFVSDENKLLIRIPNSIKNIINAAIANHSDFFYFNEQKMQINDFCVVV